MSFSRMGLFRQLALCCLLYVQTLVAVETVSKFGEEWPHSCVQYCLGRWPSLYDNIGAALSCGRPFYNDCYCATAAASASKATAFLESCASSLCAKGDFTVDLSAMQSKYASYCIENGFTQPGATNWYDPSADATTTTDEPAPGRTQDSGPVSTTTRITVVTQTTTPDSGGSQTSSRPRVTTVDAYSTVWVDPAGSVVAAPSSSDGSSKTLALGLGLGLGIPLILALTGLGLWLGIWRKRRGPQAPVLYNQPDPSHPPMGDAAPADTHQSPIPRKPVAAAAVSPSPSPPALDRTSELGSQGVRRELGGTGIHPFPDVGPSPPIQVSGQHELHGAARQPEMPGQSWSPPPQYSQVVNHPGAQPGRDRWELP